MITDKQGGEWLLQKFYDDGWKYYVKDVIGSTYLTNKEPMFDRGFLKSTFEMSVKHIDTVNKMLPKLGKNEILDIAEYLGITDWAEVAIDTHVLVRNCKEREWAKRYFAFFKHGKVYTWIGGVTSWSADSVDDVMSWEYAKLAEV